MGTRRRPGPERLLGQYFTPPEVARFVLEAARLILGREPRTLVDPACGDGAFLEMALATGLVDAAGVYGVEIDPAQVRRASRLGLGDNIVCADALADPLPPTIERARGRGFDLVVGNPPFGGGKGKGRLELRFAKRFAALACPGGAGAVILPSGVFANASSQTTRDALLEQITPVAVVELPPDAFRRTGATAATCVILFRKRRTRASETCMIVAYPGGATDSGRYFRATLRAVRARGRGRVRAAATRHVSVGDLEGRRWDPGFWCRGPADTLARSRVPLEPLGDFIEHITYGPILTGAAARKDLGGRVRVVGLKELRPAGLDLRRAKKVRAHGVHDPARCRLRPGDMVLARSGAGSLLKGRVAVFEGPGLATVGCFVDLVRLSGLAPGYATLCFGSRLVRAQVASMANGVGAPNLSFGEIRRLLVPRLGAARESRLAREEAAVRKLHARAIHDGREPVRAARRLEAGVAALDEATLGGAYDPGDARHPSPGKGRA